MKIFKSSEHGTIAVDDVINEAQIMVLQGDYNHVALQEMIIIINELRSDAESLTDEEREIQLVRVLIAKYATKEKVPDIMLIGSNTYLLDALSVFTDPEEVHLFFDDLCQISGQHVIENSGFDGTDWWNPVFDHVTVGQMLGHTSIPRSGNVEEEYEEEDLVFTIQDLMVRASSECSNSIERYKLFNKIEEQIKFLRKHHSTEE